MPRKPPAPSEPADAVLEHPLVRAAAAEAMIDELPSRERKMETVDNTQLFKLLRRQNATILAAAIISASGRPHSIEQALEIVRDIQFATNPNPGSGAYQEWAKTKDERLSKVHGQLKTAK
jgi:hypothetical protein